MTLRWDGSQRDEIPHADFSLRHQSEDTHWFWGRVIDDFGKLDLKRYAIEHKGDAVGYVEPRLWDGNLSLCGRLVSFANGDRAHQLAKTTLANRNTTLHIQYKLAAPIRQLGNGKTTVIGPYQHTGPATILCPGAITGVIAQ